MHKRSSKYPAIPVSAHYHLFLQCAVIHVPSYANEKRQQNSKLENVSMLSRLKILSIITVPVGLVVEK